MSNLDFVWNEFIPEVFRGAGLVPQGDHSDPRIIEWKVRHAGFFLSGRHGQGQEEAGVGKGGEGGWLDNRENVLP